MSETTWITMVLWLGCLVLSQFIRAGQTTQGGLMAFGALFGFGLAVDLLTSGESVLGIGLIALNLYILYEALDRW